MIKIPISDAKTHLLRLIRDVMAGQSYAITKGGRIVAKVVSPDVGTLQRRVGFAQVQIKNDLSPLPAEWSFDADHFSPSPKRSKRRSTDKRTGR